MTPATPNLAVLQRRLHRGEPTPFRGQIEELVTLVADTFPCTIQPVHAYPERTSAPKH